MVVGPGKLCVARPVVQAASQAEPTRGFGRSGEPGGLALPWANVLSGETRHSDCADPVEGDGADLVRCDEHALCGARDRALELHGLGAQSVPVRIGDEVLGGSHHAEETQLRTDSNHVVPLLTTGSGVRCEGQYQLEGERDALAATKGWRYAVEGAARRFDQGILERVYIQRIRLKLKAHRGECHLDCVRREGEIGI